MSADQSGYVIPAQLVNKVLISVVTSIFVIGGYMVLWALVMPVLRVRFWSDLRLSTSDWIQSVNGKTDTRIKGINYGDDLF